MKENKKDLRYIKTEKAIRKALRDLLLEKDLSLITVKELVERAEINKTTFYAHYGALSELIETLANEKIDYILANWNQVNLLFSNSDLFVDCLYENLSEIHITKITWDESFSFQFLEKLKTALADDAALQALSGTQQDELFTILAFILHGILGVMNMKDCTKEDLDRIKAFVRQGIAGLRDFRESEGYPV